MSRSTVIRSQAGSRIHTTRHRKHLSRLDPYEGKRIPYQLVRARPADKATARAPEVSGIRGPAIAAFRDLLGGASRPCPDRLTSRTGNSPDVLFRLDPHSGRGASLWIRH